MTTAPAQAPSIPGYVAGTWTIDPIHTDISFNVRHMMVSKVRGNFKEFSGEIVTGESFADSTVRAEVQLASIETHNEQRDNHIRSADFFEVETYPTMTFSSTAIKANGDDWVLEGDLTLHGVTKSVELSLEINGFGSDAYGGVRSGFSAKGEINRSDFGVDIHTPMETGGVVVGDKINLVLEVEAILNQ